MERVRVVEVLHGFSKSGGPGPRLTPEEGMIMKKTMIAATFIVIAFAAYGFSRPPLPAQETITGDWAAKVRQTDKGQRLWLTLNSTSENGKHQFNSSFELPLAAFTGLNPDAGSI